MRRPPPDLRGASRIFAVTVAIALAMVAGIGATVEAAWTNGGAPALIGATAFGALGLLAIRRLIFWGLDWFERVLWGER